MGTLLLSLNQILLHPSILSVTTDTVGGIFSKKNKNKPNQLLIQSANLYHPINAFTVEKIDPDHSLDNTIHSKESNFTFSVYLKPAKSKLTRI